MLRYHPFAVLRLWPVSPTWNGTTRPAVIASAIGPRVLSPCLWSRLSPEPGFKPRHDLGEAGRARVAHMAGLCSQRLLGRANLLLQFG